MKAPNICLNLQYINIDDNLCEFILFKLFPSKYILSNLNTRDLSINNNQHQNL